MEVWVISYTERNVQVIVQRGYVTTILTIFGQNYPKSCGRRKQAIAINFDFFEDRIRSGRSRTIVCKSKNRVVVSGIGNERDGIGIRRIRRFSFSFDFISASIAYDLV